MEAQLISKLRIGETCEGCLQTFYFLQKMDEKRIFFEKIKGNF